MEEKILKATHQGKLTIGEKQLNCYVLENGDRIIASASVFKALGRSVSGRMRGESRMPNMPAFVDAKNLKPFIIGDIVELLKTIKYSAPNGRLMEGYRAELLPLLCDVYLNARDQKVLVPKQKPLAIASEILVRSLSKVGIVALIDEATGYQYDRDKSELQLILEKYISKELLPWTKRFPDEFYEHLFRLRGWSYNPISVKRPQLVGKITNKIVYEKLPHGVLAELKSKTPKNKTGHYTKKLHQSLTIDIGNPHLEKQLVAVITLMKISPSWRIFEGHFARAFGGQLPLEFPEENN